MRKEGKDGGGRRKEGGGKEEVRKEGRREEGRKKRGGKEWREVRGEGGTECKYPRNNDLMDKNKDITFWCARGMRVAWHGGGVRYQM